MTIARFNAENDLAAHLCQVVDIGRAHALHEGGFCISPQKGALRGIWPTPDGLRICLYQTNVVPVAWAGMALNHRNKRHNNRLVADETVCGSVGRHKRLGTR
jgi:hypothetical protein